MGRMQTQIDLQALALEMKLAQDTATQRVPFTARYPAFGLSSAYALAQRVHRLRLTEGARPVGRKIGVTNPDMSRLFPTFCPCWASKARIDPCRLAKS